MSKTTAQLLIECLEAHGVEYVFGIPGAKIDSVFDALVDSPIQVILCRHEQNAAFMAAAIGRQTGKPGVVLVTSGPGVGNLTTGLLTATTEGDAVVALGGNVALDMKFKESHQNTDNAKLMECVTKSSIEVTAPGVVPEAIANAFRAAMQPRAGAAFISLPQNVMLADPGELAPCLAPPIHYGQAKPETVTEAAQLLAEAKCPVLLLGEEASRPENHAAIQCLLERHPLPVVITYQAAGVIPETLMKLFYGRVGLFQNQPGDQLLAHADIVVSVGFNPVEYDPEIWNVSQTRKIIHIDYIPANVHRQYSPACELLGDIADNLTLLTRETPKLSLHDHSHLQAGLFSIVDQAADKQGVDGRIHPLRFIHEFRRAMDKDTIVCCDIGSVYMWLARYLFSHHPRQLRFSNGQQTLGVALPWAIASKLTNPEKKVISISGDGGFLFSAMELETAVRYRLPFVHIIWRDGAYDMVKEQQLMKYKRDAAVELGAIHVPSFAQGFGATGFEVTRPEEILPTLAKAQAIDGPVLIDIPIDYSDNPSLFESAHNPYLGN